MLCPGCFQEKNEAISVCPYCEFDESTLQSPLVLPYHTLLNNQYVVGKVLGKPGGFGITYLGWDTLLETLVAIKEYLPRDLAGRQHNQVSVAPHTHEDAELFRYGLEQFMQEARTIAKINHPNVVRVRYFFTENDTAYLVMDYYEGVALSEYLAAAGGKIPEQPAVEIMLRVLDGLSEIHEKGFLHRDIKPQNIYLTTEGKPILLDMGAARAAVGNKNRSLSVLYSSGFTPFEQYYRRGDQGTWTDIYACGATLYYLLTGVVPPDAPGRLGEDELVHPSQLEPMVSVPVAEVILRTLAMDPSQRPQTAREFQTLLLAAAGTGITDERNTQPADNDECVLPAPGNRKETADGAQTAGSAEPSSKTSQSGALDNNFTSLGHYCSNCGQQVHAGSVYCSACGSLTGRGQQPNTKPPLSAQANPASPLYPAQQHSQPRSAPGNRFLIIGIVLAAMISGAMLYGLLSRPSPSGSALTSAEHSEQRKTQGEESVVRDFDKYMRAKDTFDTQIRQLAATVNERIADSRGRLTAPDLIHQVQACQDQLRTMRGSLASTSFPSQYSDCKNRLLAVYDLELVRIDSLRRGLLAGSQGHDYLPIFKEGGDAFEQFEKQNTALNNAYTGLRGQLGQ